jgi:predicted nucleotide-binding protein
MQSNLSGSWTGELSGTNTGGMLLELGHEGDRLYGKGRFYEPKLGSYEYNVQGIAKGDDFSFFLTPRGQQGLRLGNIQATCRLSGADELNGKWSTTVGTAGVFTARRVKKEPALADVKANSVFLVHGHDEATKESVARFLEKLGLNVIILHEQVNQGLTVIEKFEQYASRVGFAVVLFTPDDIGFPLGTEEQKQPRARQNVVLEMGYFVGKLTRQRVCVLYKGGVELPSDILGVVYHSIDQGGGWKLSLAQELRAAGYSIDLNKIVA